MSTNANDPQSPAAYIAGLLRVGATTAAPESAARMRAEADRLDPPPPTGKTVTWNEVEFRLRPDGDIESRYGDDGKWQLSLDRDYIDHVVLPLLADAPDGPIPDETVDAAREAWLAAPVGSDIFRVVCEAVRGLPGMAVVRAGKPPEVLRWEVWNADNDVLESTSTRAEAYAYTQKLYKERPWKTPAQMTVRVVAIIADPGEAPHA